MTEVSKMMKVKWLVVMAILASAFWVACEEQVPAPYTTTVDILGDDVDWKVPCNDADCEPKFRGYLRHYATAVVAFPNKFAPNDPDVDQPINNAEIRWIPTTGDLWLLKDDYKPYYENKCYLCNTAECPDRPKCKDVLWPLEIPYDTATEDDGTSEILWILYFNDDAVWTDCGSQLLYQLTADIGVDADALKVTISVDSCEE